MAVIRNFRLPLGIGVSADYIETFGVIQSIDTNSGSIVARGGIGVSGNIYMGGNLSVGSSVIGGTWAGNTVAGRYGGTGYTTYTKGDLLVGAGSTFIKVGIGASHQVLSYSPSVLVQDSILDPLHLVEMMLYQNNFSQYQYILQKRKKIIYYFHLRLIHVLI
jgi:hypothetical protein